MQEQTRAESYFCQVNNLGKRTGVLGSRLLVDMNVEDKGLRRDCPTHAVGGYLLNPSPDYFVSTAKPRIALTSTASFPRNAGVNFQSGRAERILAEKSLESA